LKVHYCKFCKVPPEYCYMLAENIEDCKKWLLKERKPELIEIYKKIYGEIKEDKVKGENEEAEEEEDET